MVERGACIRYVQFVLHCGNYRTKVLARAFSNLHEELILGIPWLVQENATIDWASGLSGN